VSELHPDGVIGALAILSLGAAYVPVDATATASQVAEVAASADVAAVLVSIAAEALVAGVDAAILPLAGELAGGGPPPEVPVAPDDGAYVIYTSGSTGEPKGVVVEHRSLAAMTRARRIVYPGAPTFLLVSPLAFDSSVAGVWGTLTAGGTLVVAHPDQVRAPDRLVDLIASHCVTHTLCIPALYELVLRAASRRDDDPLRSLEVVIVAGEALSASTVDAHFASHPHSVGLVNEYGPTEGTVWASYHWFTQPGPVSIGIPAPGVTLYILDDTGAPTPDGEPGELYVGGAGVARGYLGQPEATADAFLPDPFEADGSRMYRTGDRVQRRADGNLEFLGRRDHQVKVRGHRIELGAVESALRAAAADLIDAAVVLDEVGTLRAFVVADSRVDVLAIRAGIREQIGAVATPATVEQLTALPRTSIGKVDRLALTRRPSLGPAPGATLPAADGDALALAVAVAWCTVLKIPEVPANVNFFDVGGHSLAVFELQDALEAAVGIRPSIVDLFRHPTVEGHAELVRSIAQGADVGAPAPGLSKSSTVRQHRLTRGAL
jgi:amino acid adenylation domain-containing protein